MRSWNELSMAEKADIMKLAIEGGVYDLDSIRSGYNEYAKGGKIHIDPSKRGTFTAAASKHGKSVQAFASQVLAHPENYSPAMRKKANFAKNAAKWKHGLGGNLFSGEEDGSQKMQIGLKVTNGLKPYTLDDILASAARIEQQKQAMEDRLNNAFTLSNDATSVANGRPQNRHLERKAIEGAKAHVAWEKEHPNLTAWGNTLSAVPLAVAAAPAILAGGDAAAGTAAGKAITSGFNFAANAIKTTPYISSLLPWVEATFNAGAATHGIQELRDGTFTPMTALELSPLAPPTIGIGNNLYLPHLREHIYTSKAPIGYNGFGPAIRRTAEGILSGRRADVEHPFWFNSESAKQLQDYAYVPSYIQGAEREQYLKEFGERALKARTDMWRLYNRMPQKFNTFVLSDRYPGAYTAPEDIKALKWVPAPNETVDGVDFVNSVGGNTGKPVVTNLGRGIPEGENVLSKEFGVTTVSDLWDLHPFSRPDDRIISRLQRGWKSTIGKGAHKVAKKVSNLADKYNFDEKEIKEWLAKYGNDEEAMEFFSPYNFPSTGIRKKIGETIDNLAFKIRDAGATPSFDFLKPLDEKIANYEIGRLVNAKPIMVKNDVPWTADKTMVMTPEGGVDFNITYTQGFNSNNLLPSEVDDWRKGIARFNVNDIYNWVDLNNSATKVKYVKRRR